MTISGFIGGWLLAALASFLLLASVPPEKGGFPIAKTLVWSFGGAFWFILGLHLVGLNI